MADFASHSLGTTMVIIFCILAALIAVGLGFLCVLIVRQGAVRQEQEQQRLNQAQKAEAELVELKGRLAQMTETTAARQAELTRALNERLDRVGQLLGTSVEET